MTAPALERAGCMMTVDVEEWYEPLRHRGITGWDAHALDPRPALERIVGLLQEGGHGATFFIVGTFARDHPRLVRELAAHGYEIGSHADVHEPLTRRAPEEFERGLRDSLARIEDLSGRRVEGFRAPFFSFTPWLPEVLRRCGLTYDSSIVPTSAAAHGYPSRTKNPHRMPNGLLEVPLSVRWGLPIAGLTYLKLLPGAVIPLVMRAPYVLYLHPREIDERVPVLPMPPHLRYLFYFRLKGGAGLLRRMLRARPFVSVVDHLRGTGLVDTAAGATV